jgi:hypothetical protein
MKEPMQIETDECAQPLHLVWTESEALKSPIRSRRLAKDAGMAKKYAGEYYLRPTASLNLLQLHRNFSKLLTNASVRPEARCCVERK